MNLYLYDGPVTMFGKCVTNHWSATTRAISAKKAMSNLIYRYKTQNNLNPNSKVELPGKLVSMEQDIAI